MKTVFVSLLLIVASTVKAQDVTEIRFDGNGAPIYANLTVEGVSRNMTTINSGFHNVVTAHITFNSKDLTLTLNRRMPRCAPNMMCIQVMPAPLNIYLSVIKVEHTECSVRYTATTPANVRARYSETVTVDDFTNSKCPTTMDMPHRAGYITYSVTGISSLSKQQETARANFSTENFIRALN